MIIEIFVRTSLQGIRIQLIPVDPKRFEPHEKEKQQGERKKKKENKKKQKRDERGREGNSKKGRTSKRENERMQHGVTIEEERYLREEEVIIDTRMLGNYMTRKKRTCKEGMII